MVAGYLKTPPPHLTQHSLERYRIAVFIVIIIISGLIARLNEQTIKSITMLQGQLKLIAQHLHESSFPSYVILRKGQGVLA